jgi:hypothetical protein
MIFFTAFSRVILSRTCRLAVAVTPRFFAAALS